MRFGSGGVDDDDNGRRWPAQDGSSTCLSEVAMGGSTPGLSGYTKEICGDGDDAPSERLTQLRSTMPADVVAPLQPCLLGLEDCVLDLADREPGGWEALFGFRGGGEVAAIVGADRDGEASDCGR